jgi:gliding motility-associated-like protein
VSSSGTYTVTAINGCGSVTATQTVTVTPVPVVTLNNSGSSSLCVGSSSILWATGVGNYLWSTGSTNDSITITTGGTYLVTASNSCGSVSSSIIINTIALPSPIITASGSTSICVGDSVTLVASGGDLYSWNTFDTTAIITVFTSGIYTVNVTNVCGSQTASQSVIANSSPIVSINSGGTSFCSGDSLLLWATGSGSFVWSGGAITDSVFITSAGNYFVTSTSSCGLATDTILVSELSLPNALIVPSGSTTICSGSTIVLDGFGGTSYLWFPSGATSDSTLVSSAGTYTLSATNTCGTDTATISITTLDIPTAAISTIGSTTICLGDILTLNASGSTSYLWSNGTTGNSLSVTSQGLYYVIASNICGSDTATINVVVDSVNALFSGNTLIGTYPLVVDFTNISSSTAITYSWSFGDGNSSSTFSPSNTFQTPGTYLVTLFVTNANGCTDSYAIQIIVLENPSELIIPNVFTPNNDNNNDLFVVRSSGLKEFNCVIYDRWGLEMIELASESMGWDGRTAAGVNVSDGTYYYIIKAQGLDGKVYNETGFVLLTR